MNAVIIRAHFDGEQVVLDEQVDLEPDTPLMITVLSKEYVNTQREDWIRLAQRSLARTYGDDEPEYTLDMIKEFNPSYVGPDCDGRRHQWN